MNKSMEYILKIAECKSLCKAAEELYITQPALSAILKKEERSYGVSFFNRKFKPFKLTEEGKKYINSAMKIKKIEEALKKELGQSNNCICIGCSAYFSANILPPLVKDYKSKEHIGCNCDIRIIEGNEKELYKSFNNGNLDFIITVESNYNNKDTLIYILKQEDILLAVPETICKEENFPKLDCSLQSGFLSCPNYTTVSLKRFSKEPIILLTKGNDMYTRARKMFKKIHIAPRNIIYMSQLQSAFLAAKSGQGITFIRKDLIRFMDTSGLRFFKIDDSLSRRNVYLLAKSSNITNPLKSSFLKFCRSSFNNY